MKRTTLLAALAAVGIGAAQAATTELVVYTKPDFRGASDTIKGEVNNLENGMGREISSIKARGGAWEVCTGDHFKGRCRVLPEGEYATLGGLNDRIVSVRFLGDDARFKRAPRDDRADARDARDDANRWREAREERQARREAWEEWREYKDARRDWDRTGNAYDDRVYDRGYGRSGSYR